MHMALRPVPTGPVTQKFQGNSSRAGFAKSRREFVETGATMCDFTSLLGYVICEYSMCLSDDGCVFS